MKEDYIEELISEAEKSKEGKSKSLTLLPKRKSPITKD